MFDNNLFKYFVMCSMIIYYTHMYILDKNAVKNLNGIRNFKYNKIKLFNYMIHERILFVI